MQHPLGYPNDYHRQSAPKNVWGSSRRVEAPQAEEPESTLAKGVAKALVDEIRASTAPLRTRPDGRWNSEAWGLKT